MKRLILLLALAGAVLGQTRLYETTLTNAISATDTHIVLNNWAGITAPGAQKQTLKNILIDGEMFEAVAIDPPGTNYISVVRGVRGTLRIQHPANARVWTGPTAAFFNNPPQEGGGCTRTQLQFVPYISLAPIARFDCMGAATSGIWVRTDKPGSPTYNGTAIASGTSTTVTPPAQTFKISGNSAISTIVAPAGIGSGWCLNIIPTGNFTTDLLNAGNFGKVSTAVTGRVLKLCWDTALPGWYPSY